jgi:uncharacterized protein YhfF
MTIPPKVLPFWEAFCAQAGTDMTPRFYESFYFADSEASADALAQLVLAGIKRATTGLLWSYEAAGKPAPKPGDFSIMTNWAGEPLAVIETTRVDVMAFGDVDAEFAAVEGEGDGSYDYWRRAHQAFFARECARIDRTASDEMLVACERFEVVYRR